jgi:hypothetical protein
MKKIGFYIICLFITFTSCKNSDTSTKTNDEFVNALLPNKVSITYEQAMIVPTEYWFFKGIDFPKLVTELQQKTIDGKIIAYSPNSLIPLTKVDIEQKFKSADNFKIPEFKYLVFDEEWELDTAKFIMNKKVTSYTLVREYVRDSKYETESVAKSLIAKYDFSKNSPKKFSELQLLAKDVAYEVPLKNEANPEFLENIQVKHVIDVLLAKTLCGNVQAYSFMMRDSLTALPVSDIKLRLGEETESYVNVDETTGEQDTISVDKKIEPSEITGVAFIEDWYIDTKTMQIYKDVKGIALVREYMKYLDANEPEQAKTIPFVMFFKNHPKGK